MICCSITRDNLGPYKTKVIGIPAVYFVTILIVDYVRTDALRYGTTVVSCHQLHGPLVSFLLRSTYMMAHTSLQIMDAVRGRAAFSVADFDSPDQRVHLQISELQRLLLVLCAVSHRGTRHAALSCANALQPLV